MPADHSRKDPVNILSVDNVSELDLSTFQKKSDSVITNTGTPGRPVTL
jgi:hypothetical protein